MERSYHAHSLEDVIAQVKRDLGEDAVIVSSRMVPPRGGESRRTFEVRAQAGAGLARSGRTTQDRRRLRALDRRLRATGLPEVTLESLVRRVDALLAGRLEPDDDAMELALATALDEELLFARPGVRRPARVRAFVGPTGVGKTTTIAKLAAVEALIRGRKVALVSLDHYRVGGIAQLESYADLIGVPLEVAHDTRSFATALGRLEGAEAVFVDTTGRSPRATAALATAAADLRGGGEPIEVHLCLSLSMRDAELDLAMSRYSVFEPSRLVLTKLDELEHHGVAAFVQSRSGLPFSYFATGQRVPEDVEVASARRLASLLCGKEIHA